MSEILFKGEPTETSGDIPAVGEMLPRFELLRTDLSEVTNEDFAGKRIVLNIFPSVDTGVCAQSVRRFNELASDLDDTVVVCVSMDLPFALARFCGAEGLDNVVATSAFRASFGADYGLVLAGSPLQGLLARSVIIADGSGKIVYTQLVNEITDEPDYDAALAALA
ncbi:lipid hydroperoxide peroxidase [Corynebacterium kutscheri]|uniref:Thiol peroxidase n=1 Tax=Corynebacterium kutscheri TaxID=35755 RepID=A0A0F6R0J4_9CORY|nr:thiol peroxidase [Corynebacterium kutscheri]AKE41335.1 peroxiredoxin [Corynebacterium kutscheri]VEH08611.1 lipid hydroperoxide peroxidase [Corynebacterium kutscheri]VEH09657.1 lipid hydroperoxide peroxidase [Corynebacterium kutscheri]VEH79740.1 lipid hydroperoxide peroxidase [Corynebacterium kutscheri]